MDKIEEIINRILELEKDKKELADMIPWKTEFPKQREALDAINKQLHEMRTELEQLKKSKTPTAGPAGETNQDDGGGFRGFF